MLRRLFTAASAISLLLCMATAVLWARSYFKVDFVTVASTRLARGVSGGGGLFLESLTLRRENGSWRNPSLPPVQSTMDYSAWQSAQPHMALPRWTTEPYLGRSRLAGRSWGGDLNRAGPRIDSVSFNRQTTFETRTGASVTFRLVGPRVWIPYWLIFAVTALLPACWLARRPARPSDGVSCLNCGYDLRASKDRCPECGTPITSNVVKTSA